jgi:serine acetyltransferase
VSKKRLKTSEVIQRDLLANRGRPHIQLMLVLFRTAQALRRSHSVPGRVMSISASALYRVVALFGLSIDIPVSTKIGPGLAIHHGFGLVVHNNAVLGADVTLRQGVTIGAKTGSRDAPIIGNLVSFGSSAQVIGKVFVGRGSSIGAGAVVTKSVDDGARMVGNPARALPMK